MAFHLDTNLPTLRVGEGGGGVGNSTTALVYDHNDEGA